MVPTLSLEEVSVLPLVVEDAAPVAKASAPKKAVAEKFPDAPTKGIAMYGWLRSTQMRRMRTPKPSINRGDAF